MNLADARKQKNLTQEAVADALRITRAAYANIELGRRKPSVSLAKKIGEVLGINWPLLFEDDKPA